MVASSDLAQARAVVRGGARYLLKVDVSQFYPSLYAHAVGWSIDPKLRNRANWNNRRLLGRRVDQAIMDLQGKISQGIPIGSDISFLLAEVVLAQVDKAIRLPHDRAVRWYDDYEIACDTMEEAERWLAKLNAELHRFRLRVNAAKTRIVSLPEAANETWRTSLLEACRTLISTRLSTERLLAFFDLAFRLRVVHAEAPVLNYALGLLFKLPVLERHAARLAQSCTTQAMLAEPGSVQKGMALLTYWSLNGVTLDDDLLAETITQMILQQRHRGFSNDVAWALSFCLQRKLRPAKRAVDALANCDDNCITIQALHMKDSGLLPRGFASRSLRAALRNPILDGEDWLLIYEAHRQGFANIPAAALAGHPLFADMLSKDVPFYRRDLPAYASVIHPGGAPEWVVRRWLATIREAPQPQQRRRRRAAAAKQATPLAPRVVALVAQDVSRVGTLPKSDDELIARLLASKFAARADEDDEVTSTYPG